MIDNFFVWKLIQTVLQKACGEMNHYSITMYFGCIFENTAFFFQSKFLSFMMQYFQQEDTMQGQPKFFHNPAIKPQM